LRGIGKGRGVLWRTLGRTPLKQKGISLEQVKIESKTVGESEIVTQRSNYYFDVSLAAPDGTPLPSAVGWQHKETRLIMPYEIGWLHFDSSTDNEALAPGLGHSLAYGAPGIKATIYIYDKGRSDILKDVSGSIVKGEFNSAVSDLMKLHPKAVALGDLSYKGSMVYKKFLIDQDLSIVAMALRAGKFVKLRMTFVNDPDLADLADQSLSTFQELVSDFLQGSK